MATNTWRSANGSGNWSDPNNWFTLNLPGTADTVLFNSTVAYTATVDVPFLVGQVLLTDPAATLDIASTLTVSGTLSAAASTQVALFGIFAGGTLDLTGGGSLVGDGGTLEGTTVLGDFSVLAGPGAISNAGSIGWAGTADASINIGSAQAALPAFSNTGQFVLNPGSAMFSNTYVTSTYVQHGQTIPVTSELMWLQTVAATVSVGAVDFSNSGTMSLDAGTLTVTGATFDNSGFVGLLGEPTQLVQPVGTSDGYTLYGVVNTVQPGQLTIGAGVTSYANTGTISASNIEFQGPMTLAQLGTLNGGLTFDAGLDLGGGTLSAGTMSVGGLVQNGSIGGSGTLTLQAGATLDNVAIGAGVQVIEPSSGNVTIVDPPSTGAAVTLDAVVNQLLFNTVSNFDGSILLGPGASNDVIGVFTAGGVTLGPDFSLTDNQSSSLLTFGGPGAVQNQGNWTVGGATINVGNTLDGSGVIDLNDGALVQVATLAADAAPAVAFGTGVSQLVLPGTGAIGAVLSGLTLGDVIDFASVSSVPPPGAPFGDGGAGTSDGSLNVQGASGDQASVALAQTSTALHFTVGPDQSGGSLVQVACFVAGTLLATDTGELAVERVRPGDRLRTAGGRLAPVRWVGWTEVDLSRHPAPARAAPVRIRADAIAQGVPRRDLLVSPEHCLLIEGALIPAGVLGNGASIAREDRLQVVTYWHVELDRHDILLAEGMAAESYLDTGNRAMFAGEAGVRALHPDLAAAPDAAALRVWAAHGCAPLRLAAPAPRAALLARAEALGWRLGTDAGVSVRVDGRPFPCTDDANGLALRLPPGAARVELRSRTFVPAETEPGSGDIRRLGLAVAAVCLGGWKLHPRALRRGWHAPAGEAWRWTDGDAEIALPRQQRPGLLTLRLHRLGHYWQAPTATRETSANASLMNYRARSNNEYDAKKQDIA